VEVSTPDEEHLSRAASVLEELIGVHSFAIAYFLARPQTQDHPGKTTSSLESLSPLIESTVVGMAKTRYAPGLSYAVRVRRADKRIPETSVDLEVRLGSAVRERTPWTRVNLDRPDRTFHVDIYEDGVFLYDERRRGVGGLPVGTSSRVLSLLSGGIDSPVSSFLLARRGCEVDFFHMSAAHFAESDFEESVIGRLAMRLSRFTLRSRLFVVPYTHFDLAMPERATGCEAVLFRRFLFRVAEALATSTRSVALVAGDSLAQVASQTVENLVTTSKSVDRVILRPLVGFDKQQIMDIASEIGTYEISIQPYKDCCALFGRRPKTKTYDEPLAALERRLLPDYRALVKRSIGDLMWGAYDCGELVSVGQKVSEANALAVAWKKEFEAKGARRTRSTRSRSRRRSRAEKKSSRGIDAA
jgi:thiamine biosynthesis protein ThiI